MGKKIESVYGLPLKVVLKLAADDIEQCSPLPADIANLLTNEDKEETNSVIREIATHINSLRLSCENCLNKECPQRDPSLEK